MNIGFFRRMQVAVMLLLVASLVLTVPPAIAGSAAEIDKEVALSLEKLYATSPAAVELSKVSKGILVFPNVVKAGLVVGGQ
ncbi:MAG TPA: twin-arginine translocation pathway signal protein, partial [Desulfuromonadales bacterium]